MWWVVQLDTTFNRKIVRPVYFPVWPVLRPRLALPASLARTSTATPQPVCWPVPPTPSSTPQLRPARSAPPLAPHAVLLLSACPVSIICTFLPAVVSPLVRLSTTRILHKYARNVRDCAKLVRRSTIVWVALRGISATDTVTAVAQQVHMPIWTSHSVRPAFLRVWSARIRLLTAPGVRADWSSTRALVAVVVRWGLTCLRGRVLLANFLASTAAVPPLAASVWVAIFCTTVWHASTIQYSVPTIYTKWTVNFASQKLHVLLLTTPTHN